MSKSPSKIRGDGREVIGMIQPSGIHQVIITTVPIKHSSGYMFNPDDDHRELYLELHEDNCKIRETRLRRKMAEALISLLYAGIDSL